MPFELPATDVFCASPLLENFSNPYAKDRSTTLHRHSTVRRHYGTWQLPAEIARNSQGGARGTNEGQSTSIGRSMTGILFVPMELAPICVWSVVNYSRGSATG